MTYRILLQREGEDQWTTVGKDLGESTCVFDESAWPEGRYRLKAIASDASSNYPSEALEAETTAEGVILDLSPPVLDVQASKGSGPLRVRASDTLSPIASADIVSGDRTVTLARPADGVLDSRTELLEIDIPPGIPLEKLKLRVRDAAGNEATLELAKAAR